MNLLNRDFRQMKIAGQHTPFWGGQHGRFLHSENVKNNNLNYTAQDIEDISWHGTNESIQFISHFEELAKKNGTTKDEEIDLWRKRVSQLSHSYTNIVKKTEVNN